MKKLILLIAIIGFSLNGMAQKKSDFEKRAKRSSNAIADKMNLKKDRKTFLYEAILDKQKQNLARLKDQELTEDQKSEIYAETSRMMNEKLSEKFTQNEIQTINSLIREQQSQKRKGY
ncbi:hypothetical protein [Urechidicola vernalis]|uniref:DUF4890 domain-containing protein n=1 Tax=Urechidicola vernalis TaxID=3075600 RepID=A0ABU2Y3S9_9FLAO|nr:hypothetical protein [Urechidicola sp. P050]MDT0552863.1 hypothetical protein [Urechidicola sp. P050]